MTQIDVILHEEDAIILPFSNRSLRELTTELVPVFKGVPDGEPMLFDTLFHAGNTEDRFSWARIKNEAIDWDTVTVINVPKNSPLRAAMAVAIQKENEYLQSSILSSAQKKMFAAGMAI